MRMNLSQRVCRDQDIVVFIGADEKCEGSILVVRFCGKSHLSHSARLWPSYSAGGGT